MKLVHGNIAVLDGDVGISRWVEEAGRIDHDLGVRDRICPFIPAGGVVVDGGANLGSHAVPYAERVGNNGTVFAFEPNPFAYACLVHNTKPFHWVHCSPCALTENDSGTYMHLDPTNVGGSYSCEGGTLFVPSVAIDSLDLDRCDLIKLDIEGSELRALKGASQTLKKLKPILILEVNRGHLARAGKHSVEELYGFLRGHEYTVEDWNGQSNTDQYDVICKPTSN